MIEPELAFADIHDDMNVAEAWQGMARFRKASNRLKGIGV